MQYNLNPLRSAWSEPRVPRLTRVITKTKNEEVPSLSRSKKKSYAAALGPADRGRKPGEVYSGDILFPTGITNVANNCYINAVVQCLCNHPKMSSILYQLTASHPNHCSSECCTASKLSYTHALKIYNARSSNRSSVQHGSIEDSTK